MLQSRSERSAPVWPNQPSRLAVTTQPSGSLLLPEHAQLIRVRPVDRPMATVHQLRCAEPCSGVFGLGVMFALEAALLAEISPLLTRFDRGGWQWSTTTFHRFDLRGRLLLIGFGCRR